MARVLEATERALTGGFHRFMFHYRFQAEVRNPASGNEKGNIENTVGYSRKNAFASAPTITSLEEFNQRLGEWCEKDAQCLYDKGRIPIRELWAAKPKRLRNLLEHPFPISRYEAVTVNK